jgi:hypothetical protein
MGRKTTQSRQLLPVRYVNQELAKKCEAWSQFNFHVMVICVPSTPISSTARPGHAGSSMSGNAGADPSLVLGRSHGGSYGDASPPGFSSRRSRVAVAVQDRSREVDRESRRGNGTMSSFLSCLTRYADDIAQLARTEPDARQARERLQSQCAALRLVVNRKRVA